MSSAWMAAFAALALVVVVQGGLVIGLIRRVDGALARAEQATYPLSPADSGLPPGSRVPPFSLYDASGTRVESGELWADLPALLLLTDPGCRACTGLLDELSARPWQSPEVNLVVIGSAGARAAGTVMTLYQVGDAAALALESSVSPHAFLIGTEGTVLNRRVPRDVRDLHDLAGTPLTSSVA